MINLVKRVCTFCTKICDLINNYVHHRKKQPHQEVEDCYIFDYSTNNHLCYIFNYMNIDNGPTINHNIPFKVYSTARIMHCFGRRFIKKHLLDILKVDFTVNMEEYLCVFLVVMYV